MAAGVVFLTWKMKKNTEKITEPGLDFKVNGKIRLVQSFGTRTGTDRCCGSRKRLLGGWHESALFAMCVGSEYAFHLYQYLSAQLSMHPAVAWRPYQEAVSSGTLKC